MADIFRGPLFIGKREFAPVLSVTALAVSSLLTTTLAVILSLPPGAQSLPPQVQHPGHQVALNQDTTCDSPQTLRPDKQLPFFNAAHFVQPHKYRQWLNQDESAGTAKTLIRDNQAPVFVPAYFAPSAKAVAGWLPADATRGTPKGLTADKQLPFFVAPSFAPNAKPARGLLPAETSLKQPITLQTIVLPPPIVPTVYLSPLRFWWMPDDSSSGIAKVAFADARLPFQSQPYTVDPEVRRWVVDTSLGSPAPIRTVVAAPLPPGLSAHIPVQRRTWPVVDTSRGTPKGLTADAARPFPSTPFFAIGRQFPIRDTSAGIAAPLRTIVAPPFITAVWLQVERPQQVVARSFINTPPALLPGILDLSRIYTVAPIDRTFSIGPFVRTYTVAPSNRTYTIASLSYNLSVSGPG
jgi:hypothetical protein